MKEKQYSEERLTKNKGKPDKIEIHSSDYVVSLTPTERITELSTEIMHQVNVPA